ILSEAFLSFLGIGIREPLPSWGNLAADGLSQLNPVQSRWWLLVWPCLCIAVTLTCMNWIGQTLRKRVLKTSQGVQHA
ncbi:MAG: ABC transporter permease, partial [Phycisphaerales bacterium]